MPRNAEVIRQWTILREIERARGSGVTIDGLASLTGVTTRTIRRDLQARLLRDGYGLRVYIPFGSQWFPYLTRRLAERPANLVFFIRNFFRG